MASTSATSAMRIGRIAISDGEFSSSGAVAIAASGEPLIEAARELEVLPCLALVLRRAQQVGGVIGDHQRDVELTEAVHLAAQPRQRRLGAEQVLGGDAP